MNIDGLATRSMRQPSSFDSLPRELRLAVFSHCSPSERVKLSRVSKSWQDLCLDGQLWPELCLAPIAAMHPNTLRRIMRRSGFITHIDARGADEMMNMDFANLVYADLRGTQMGLAPLILGDRLRIVILKGTAVGGETLRSLARSPVEQLDVSRCWNLTLGDVVVFLRLSLGMAGVSENNQSIALRRLHVAGLKSYHAPDLFPLLEQVPLEVLDIQGCTLPRFERYACDSLTHLIASNCAIDLTILRLPALKKLELAGTSPPETALIDMLKSLRDTLTHLDLEGVKVSDRVLEAIPATLEHLRIGYARATPEGILRMVKRLNGLKTLEADNTNASNAVMRDFLRRRGADARLSLVDCSGITSGAYATLAPITRPRASWSGPGAIPFDYHPDGVTDMTEDDHNAQPVLKTFWSWRRVGVPLPWREARESAENAEKDHIMRSGRVSRHGSTLPGGDGGGGGASVTPSRRRRESCLIM